MSEIQLSEVLQDLSSNEKERIFNSLIKIRNSIAIDAKNIDQFRSFGGLKILVDLLKRPNQKNLDLALSILGNCCLHERCSVAVGQLEIFEILVSLIQNIAKDSILCRACRLLGNLSTHKANAESFHNVGAICALIGILKMYLDHEAEVSKNIPSQGTVAMSIRALGILWSIEHCRDDMLSTGVARIIFSILGHRDTYDNPDKLEFTNVILKALVTMTTLDKSEKLSVISEYLANQICYDSKATELLANIIDKASKESNNKYIKINSKLALSILFNLCGLHACRDHLGKSKALSVLIRNVDKELGFKSLILLCRDRRVHAKARSSGALKALLTCIKNSELKKKTSLVLDVLSQYILDKCIIMELVNDGLINVIISIISNFVQNSDCMKKPVQNCKHTCNGHPHCNNATKDKLRENVKMKRSRDSKCDNSFKKLLIDGESTQFTYYLSSIPSSPYNSRALWSPQSDSTGYGSMGTTPPRRESVASDDFESYSPICSDNEGECEKENVEQTNIDEEFTEDQERNDLNEFYDDHDDDISYTDENTEIMEDLEMKENYHHDIYICVRLLQQVTFYGCIVPQLAQAETILPLFKFIASGSQGLRYAVYALNEILGRVEYLKTILKTDLVYQMYKNVNANMSECNQCRKAKDRITKLRIHLRNVAESPCGVGEIENILCLGSEELKTKYILEIALLIDSVTVLKNILFKFGALDILSNLLADPVYKKSAIIALINYAKILKKDDPTKERVFSSNKCDQTITDEMFAFDNKVTFILDDGFRMDFDEKILKEKSDVFRAMLESNFLEQSRVIHLNDVGCKSLIYFFNLLVLNIEDMAEIAPPVPQNINVATEVLMLTDKYLLPELNNILCKIIVQFILNSENVVEIYEQCLYLKTENLKQKCLAYILSSDKILQKICDQFEHVEDHIFDQFIVDLKELFRLSVS